MMCLGAAGEAEEIGHYFYFHRLTKPTIPMEPHLHRAILDFLLVLVALPVVPWSPFFQSFQSCQSTSSSPSPLCGCRNFHAHPPLSPSPSTRTGLSTYKNSYHGCCCCCCCGRGVDRRERGRRITEKGTCVEWKTEGRERGGVPCAEEGGLPSLKPQGKYRQ